MQLREESSRFCPHCNTAGYCESTSYDDTGAFWDCTNCDNYHFESANRPKENGMETRVTATQTGANQYTFCSDGPYSVGYAVWIWSAAGRPFRLTVTKCQRHADGTFDVEGHPMVLRHPAD